LREIHISSADLGISLPDLCISLRGIYISRREIPKFFFSPSQEPCALSAKLSTVSSLEQAARAIESASCLLFSAGAGMSVDSGLPDFRGNEGFWRAYPPFEKSGLQFAEVANPRWFTRDPQLAWGFYGHRLHLYRATIPHAGFAITKRWSETKPARVFTSNVDGQFGCAGFSDDVVCEVHGSLGHLQCTRPCSNAIWNAENITVEVDTPTFRAQGDLPTCPRCGALARPNVLMFGDSNWLSKRTDAQLESLNEWAGNIEARSLVVIEMGAGGAIPTVRRFGEGLQRQGATLVRINPRESDGPSGTISIAMGALAALEAIEEVRSGRASKT